MTKYYIFIGLVFSVLFATAQHDTIIKNQSLEYQKGFKINAKLIEKHLEIDDNTTTSNDISYLFTKKKKPLNISYNFDLNKYLNPNKAPRSFMLGPKPLENDVMVVKHFDGKNTTDASFKTAQNLGTIESNTEFVRIEYKDFGLVDGDRVRVFLNEKEIDANVHLSGLFYTLHIKLEKKGYNRIDIQAINQGYVGPNTAEFIAYDDNGNIIVHKAWNLKKGETATLGILKF